MKRLRVDGGGEVGPERRTDCGGGGRLVPGPGEKGGTDDISGGPSPPFEMYLPSTIVRTTHGFGEVSDGTHGGWVRNVGLRVLTWTRWVILTCHCRSKGRKICQTKGYQMRDRD